jgi:hypothetical protein
MLSERTGQKGDNLGLARRQLVDNKNRPPQSVASCRLSARHILKNAILQAHLIKTTRILIIYKGRHIFSPLSMPGTLLDCGGLNKNIDAREATQGKQGHNLWIAPRQFVDSVEQGKFFMGSRKKTDG